MAEFCDQWRPIGLPQLESTAAGLLFLGRPIPVSAPGLAPILHRCDGTRPLAAFAPAERTLLHRCHGAGLLVLAPPPRPAPDPPVIVSPHPDDAALALGGLLARRGGRVLNAFSVETWTSRPYYAARPELTSRLLLAEDAVACQVLGAEVESLGFVDAADRPAHATGFLADPVAAEPMRAEPELFAALIARLGKELAGATEVYVPLAVGGHLDHLACREAVRALVSRGELTARISYYEDQPYSLFQPAEDLAVLLGLRSRLLPLDPVAARAKQEALKAYRIQVRAGIRRRLARREAERVWE